MVNSKFNLRLPDDLRVRAQALAERDGLSLNALCVMALRSHVDWQSRRPPPRLVALMSHTTTATSGLVPKVGADQLCPCGSGQKYKRCHGKPGGEV